MPQARMSARKAEIVRTAGRLFAERGFQGTSLRDIGNAVALRRGSLYSHFDSKDEILGMLLAPAVRELGEVLDDVARTPGTGRDQLWRGLEAALDCARRHRDAILVLFQDRQLIEESPVLREVADEAKCIAPRWLAFIEQGQADGSIRDDVPTPTIALAIVALLVGALSDRHLGIYAASDVDDASRSELGHAAASLIFQGIEPR